MRATLVVMLSLVVALAGVACSERTTGPSEQVRPELSIGTPVEGSAIPGAPTVYELRLPQATGFGVRLEALTGSVRVDVRDSEGVTLLASVQATAGGSASGVEESSRLLGTASQVLTVTTSGNGSYRLTITGDGAPAGAQLTLGEIYTGVLLSPHELASFSFQASEGDVLIGYVLVGPEADSSHAVNMAIRGPPGNSVLGSVRSPGKGQTHRYYYLTVTEPLAASGTHVVTVTGSPTEYTGTYTLEVRKLDRAPENAQVMLAANDTIRNEGIEYARDIDEYILAGEPGDEFNIRFRGVNLAPGATMRMTVEKTKGETMPFLAVMSEGPNAGLGASGVFAIPESGQVYVNVTSGPVATYGPYELIVNGINRMPEVAAPELTLNEPVTTETAGFQGDIDEFHITLPVPMRVNLVLAPAPDGPGRLAARMMLDGNPGVGIILEATEAGPGGQVVTLPAGGYMVRVTSYPANHGFTGRYTLALFHVPEEPEGRPGDFLLEEIVEEAVLPPGDSDRFRLTTSAMEDIRIFAQGLGPADGTDLAISINPANKLRIDEFTFPAQSPTLEGQSTGRLRLLEPGAYDIFVAGAVTSLHDGLSYRFQVSRYPTGTETHSGNVVLDETVDSESLDVPGDVDEFLVTGEPGQEVVAWIQFNDSRVRMHLFDPATGEAVAVAARGNNSPRFLLPASGSLSAKIHQDGVNNFDVTGNYSFGVRAIDRRPEIASAELEIEVPVSSEDLSPGDVDEFWFDGVADAIIEGIVDRLAGFLGSRAILEIFAEGGTEPLGRADDRFGSNSTGPVTLPSTGRYMVRVTGGDTTMDTGPYAVTVRYVP